MADTYREPRYDLLLEEDKLLANRLIEIEKEVGGEDKVDTFNIYEVALYSKNNCIGPMERVTSWFRKYIGPIFKYIRPSNKKEAAAIIAAYAAAEIRAQRNFGILHQFTNTNGNPLTVEWLKEYCLMDNERGDAK